MPLPSECLKCKGPLAAKADAAIAILVLGDEYIYSYFFCKSCRSYTVESYHDRFMGEDEISFLPPIEKEEGDKAVALIRACPDPMDKHCECASHKALYYGTPR